MKTLHWIFYTLLNLMFLLTTPIALILNFLWTAIGIIVVGWLAVCIIGMEETNEARRKLKKGNKNDGGSHD